jgi:hypothetical protein
MALSGRYSCSLRYIRRYLTISKDNRKKKSTKKRKRERKKMVTSESVNPLHFATKMSFEYIEIIMNLLQRLLHCEFDRVRRSNIEDGLRIRNQAIEKE